MKQMFKNLNTNNTKYLSSYIGLNLILFHFVEEGGTGDPQGGSGFYLMALEIFQCIDNRHFFRIRDGLIKHNFLMASVIFEIWDFIIWDYCVLLKKINFSEGEIAM